MKIFISTLGRPVHQVTLAYFNKKWLKHVRLVVVPSEVKAYRKIAGIYGIKELVVLPKKVQGLSANRQWLLENQDDDYLCFLDDDLHFHIRDDYLKLNKCKAKDFAKLLETWEGWLKSGEYAMVGVSTRNGNNRITEDYAENGRIMSCYAFNRNILLKHNVRFDRIPVMQDFDVVLQLLEAGYKNCVSYKFAHEQARGSGGMGGCSLYRTSAIIRAGANKLLSLHPKVVKVVAKKSKTGWKTMEKKPGVEGTVRTDVNIQWKKAYAGKGKIKKKGILDRIR